MAIQSPSQPENFSYVAPEGLREVWPTAPPSITLRRVATIEQVFWWTRMSGEFELVEPIQYDDADLNVRITLPRAGTPFRTDLTSTAGGQWLPGSPARSRCPCCSRGCGCGCGGGGRWA